MIPPLVQSSAELDEVLPRMEADELVAQIEEVVNATLNNPAIPLFARVAGIMAIVAGSANGALEMLDEGASVTQFHRHDLVPDIAKMLRSSAVIYEELEQRRSEEIDPLSLKPLDG